jgi:hypothetical protein
MTPETRLFPRVSPSPTMSSSPPEANEVLTRLPAGKARPTPLLFIHGAYAAAWCWEDHFLPSSPRPAMPPTH